MLNQSARGFERRCSTARTLLARTRLVLTNSWVDSLRETASIAGTAPGEIKSNLAGMLRAQRPIRPIR
jgi:hypothetical protein